MKGSLQIHNVKSSLIRKGEYIMGISILNGGDDFRYLLYQIGTCENQIEKEELEKKGSQMIGMAMQICKKNSDVNKFRVYTELCKSIFESFIRCNDIGRRNYKDLFIVNNLFRKMARSCKIHSSEEFSISNIHSFLEVLYAGNSDIKTGVVCAIFSFLSIEYKKKIFEDISYRVERMSYEEILLGLNNGAVRYSTAVRKVFAEKIRNMSEEELNETNSNNPIYQIIYMYIIGLLDIYDLRDYDEFCCKSYVLGFCLHPDYYECEDRISEDWKKLLLKRKEYANWFKRRKYNF